MKAFSKEKLVEYFLILWGLDFFIAGFEFLISIPIRYNPAFLVINDYYRLSIFLQELLGMFMGIALITLGYYVSLKKINLETSVFGESLKKLSEYRAVGYFLILWSLVFLVIGLGYFMGNPSYYPNFGPFFDFLNLVNSLIELILGSVLAVLGYKISFEKTSK